MAKGKEYEMMIAISGKVNASLGNSIKNANKQIGGLTGTLSKLGKLAASAFALGAVKDAVVDAVNTYSEYETSLKNAAAISSATAEEQKKLAAAAREAGNATSFTAAESADALGYMALAGWDVETSTKALTPVLKLAEATGADLATTSDMVTDSMSAMGLTIDDLGGYLDVLTAANNNSNTTAEALMEAMIGAGGAARAAGVNYQDTAVALGILANNGIKGAEAGTALNSMLVRMTTKSTSLNAMKELGVSVYDASGNMRELRDILIDTDKALSGMDDSQRNAYMSAIAGTNYYSQFQYLLNGVKESADGSASSWDNLAASIYNSAGSMENFHATATDTIAYKMKLLESAIDDVKLSFVETFGPAIADVIAYLASNVFPLVSDAASQLSSVIATLAEKVRVAINFFREHEGIAVALETALVAAAAAAAGFMAGQKLQGIIKMWQEAKLAIALYTATMEGATVAQGAMNGVLTLSETLVALLTGKITLAELATLAWTKAQAALSAVMSANPIGLIVAAIAALIAIIIVVVKNWDKIREAAGKAADWIKVKFAPVIEWFKSVWNKVSSFALAAWETIKAAFAMAAEWFSTNVIQPLLNIVVPIVSKITEIVLKIWEIITAVFGVLAQWLYDTFVAPAVRGFQIMWEVVTSIFANVAAWFSAKFTEAWEAIKLVFAPVGEFFGNLWNIIKEKFTTIGTAIGNAVGGAFRSVVNAVINFAEKTINGFINSVNSAIGVANKLPGVSITKLQALSIPRMAEGGIVTAPTLAEVGEGGEPEAVIPLSRLADILGSLKQKPSEKEGDSFSESKFVFSPQIIIQGNADKSQIDSAMDEAYERFKSFMDQYRREHKRLSFV